MTQRRYRELGVTSLFIVIFASIIMSIITLSFIALMIREQQRSTDNEQSQSAYDSAMAGVEDGKRVIVACQSGNTSACAAIANKQCDTVQSANIGVAGASAKEVMVQSNTAGDGTILNQAYTCVIITNNTPDVKKKLDVDQSTFVPIRAVSPVDKVEVSWFTRDDAGANTATLPATALVPSLPRVSDWTSTTPPLIRAQLMQYPQGDIQADKFDGGDARTLFLYPTNTVGALSFASDTRRVGGDGQPYRASCSTIFTVSGYACKATIDLPSLSAGGVRDGLLRLTAMYGSTNLQVKLLDAAGAVNFDNVQPSIDSTGRANDLFRRVDARVETSAPDFPFPRATVDITGNFCKVFSVTDDPSGYVSGTTSCTP